jgi:hypothetical protein
MRQVQEGLGWCVRWHGPPGLRLSSGYRVERTDVGPHEKRLLVARPAEERPRGRQVGKWRRQSTTSSPVLDRDQLEVQRAFAPRRHHWTRRCGAARHAGLDKLRPAALASQIVWPAAPAGGWPRQRRVRDRLLVITCALAKPQRRRQPRRGASRESRREQRASADPDLSKVGRSRPRRPRRCRPLV